MIASLHAMECTPYRDECRNTAKFKYAGQNIFDTFGYIRSDKEIIKLAIDYWWSESDYVADIVSFDTKNISQFVTMAQDHSNVIGCAASGYTRYDNTELLFLVCNYSFRDLNGVPIYKTGDPTSGCKTGINRRYKNLCSRGEVVDMNDWCDNCK